jgi:16S rRNA (cytosine967-C5)-methyltransferase
LTPSARLAAAIEVLSEVEERHKPVRMALKNWGERARYAGSGDRAWVSGLVLDALRRKRSLACRMGEETARAIAIGALRWAWKWSNEDIENTAAGEPHGPGAVSREESINLMLPLPGEHPRVVIDVRPDGVIAVNKVETTLDVSSPEAVAADVRKFGALPDPLDSASAPVQGDYPDWLDAPLERAYGDDRVAQAQAQASRAPVDLRANTLKSDRDRVLKVLGQMGAEPSDMLVNALRLAAPEAHKRPPAVENEPIFAKGAFEVQDQGSQLAAAAAGAIKGKQVLDLCSGGGGKTLALAAALGNSGQIYAYDVDARRLSEVVKRGQRAGIRNLQVRSPSQPDPLHGLDGHMDVVFVDAPCTGSGTWRRHPDAKWRLQPGQLEQRMKEQDAVLDQAARCARPGGRIVYVTCSILCEENEDRVAAFLARTPGFAVRPALDGLAASGLVTAAGLERLAACATPEGCLRLSPRASGTDGFFIAVLEREGRS